MKTAKFLSLTFLILIFAFSTFSYADVPQMINYQGKITTPEGALVDTTVSMVFTIYDAATDGGVLWADTHSAVVVEKGVFNVLLGSVNPLPDTVFPGDVRYLGVKVGEDPEMTPRKAIVSVAYAYRSGADGDWTVDGDNIYRLDGNVGIGTANPQGLLQVGEPFIVTLAEDVGISHWTDPEHTPDAKLEIVPGTATNRDLLMLSSTAAGDGDLFIVKNNGNVGIGVTNPIDKLAVRGNLAMSGKATIGPHANSGAFAFVAGQGSIVTGDHATVSGGLENFAMNYAATVGGGEYNWATEQHTTVGGGYSNDASGELSTVGGGDDNTASGPHSTVGGGQSNVASNTHATVSGGEDNSATQPRSTVGGGAGNNANGGFSTIGGGLTNTTSQIYCTVGGGTDNVAAGPYSTVGGGYENVTEGDYSVIPGGQANTLTTVADYSMAFGNQVYVNSAYRVNFFDGGNSGRFGLNRDSNNGGINHPIHVGTNAANGNGAHLTAGGTWQNGSSREFKENFQPLGHRELLAKISSMPIESWQYKDSDERHIGPVSEDFGKVFDVGTVKEDGTRDNQYLAAGDVAGVALAGVKELVQQNQELRQIIEELKQRIAELEKTE